MKKFIVLEGLDGSGQTTQVKLIKEYLEEKGTQVVATKEPTPEAPIGTLIREILQKKHSVDPCTLQLLFCADRSEHIKNVINPSLKQGKCVVSDRYFFSTIAYGSLDCDTDWLINLNAQFPKPDLVIFIDTSPTTCLERIDTNREGRDFFEEEDKLTKIREIYDEVFKKFPEIKIVDGEKNIEEVFEQIKTHIDSLSPLFLAN